MTMIETWQLWVLATGLFISFIGSLLYRINAAARLNNNIDNGTEVQILTRSPGIQILIFWIPFVMVACIPYLIWMITFMFNSLKSG